MSKSTTNNTLSNTDCVIINAIPLMIKEYNHQRVVTFKDIDTVHGRPEGTAKRNFQNNKKHFIEGVDFFMVCADEIRTNKIMDISPKTHAGIAFVTETGYLMLVKSFTDDLAWKVQRDLVNTYFKAKEMVLATQGLAEIVQNLQSEITDMKKTLEAKPTQPNYWLWKKHIANSAVNNVANALNIDMHTAYDMVYDNMSAVFGFDKSFAINQFCVNYKVETAPVIDAIADCPQYQIEFVQAVNNLLNAATPQEQAVKMSPTMDKVQSAIEPLIKKLGDKSANGARTYGKVYSMVTTERGWKSLLTRHRCNTKKQVLMKSDKIYKQFVKCVNQLLGEEV